MKVTDTSQAVCPGSADSSMPISAILDELPIEERAYHHLDFTQPLVEEIMRHVLRIPAEQGPILLIGGNSLLAHAMLRHGYDLTIWALKHGYLDSQLHPYIERSFYATEMANEISQPARRRFAVIVLPLILEALDGGSKAYLSALRKNLHPDGGLILAVSHLNNLEARLAAIVGGNFAPRTVEGDPVSLSWPMFASARPYHRGELLRECRDAGFKVSEAQYVVANRPFMGMETLALPEYLKRLLSAGLKRLFPSIRDVLLVRLERRAGDGDVDQTNGEVSVLVAVREGGERLRRLLESIHRQTNLDQLAETIVLHDGGDEGVEAIVEDLSAKWDLVLRTMVVRHPSSPEALNLAFGEARGSICASTDDTCNVSDDWIQAALAWFDSDTAVVSGPVFAAAGSIPRFMDAPGSRPDEDERGVPSHIHFPTANCFYRRLVVMAAGGFDESFSRDGNRPRVGWDSELPWRLRRLGWNTRFQEEVYATKSFAPTSRLRWISGQWSKARDLPHLIRKAPDFGDRLLVSKVFASSYTLYFDLLILGAIASLLQFQWIWMLLGLPWLIVVGQRLDLWPPQQWPGSLRSLMGRGLRHFVWLIGLLWGSATSRRLVL